jgi:glycosyltransferase involved in cell wall biosynthesis
MSALLLISGLATGGAERVSVSFLKRAAALGHGVAACTVTSRHDGPLALELERAGVERHDLGAARLASPAAVMRLHKLLLSGRFQVVHAHGQDAGILAAAVRRLSATPLIITRHVLEEPVDTPGQRLRARAALAAFRMADRAVAVSAAAADRLAELGGVPRQRISVITNGIDLKAFANVDATAARRLLNRERGLFGDESLILAPAMLRNGKGHDVLLRAMARPRLRAARVRLLLAGDGERQASLVRLCDELGVAEQVEFLGARSDLPRLLAACHLVVLPSLAEALPTALMEAAAAARPCVATAVGGTPEVVVHGRTGLLVPPGDPVRLADAMAELLGDSGRCTAMGHAARRHADACFGVDRQIHDTVRLWHQLASGRAA